MGAVARERRMGGRGERREVFFSIKIMHWVCTVFLYAWETLLKPNEIS
jgi:hypothetical protein